jgi:hypothetical protein
MEGQKVAMFGCWGDNFVRGSIGTAMDDVLKTIVNDKQDHIIIAGDNYYAEKRRGMDEKVTKIIHIDAIDEIIKKLPDVPIDIITGNHEMDETDSKKIQYESSTPFQATTNCEIVKLELSSIDAVNKVRSNQINVRIKKMGGLSENTNSIQPPVSMIGNDCYLFIDSSMYEYSPEEMGCYTHVYGEWDLNQAEMIRELLQTVPITETSRIFFVAHHPLLVFRYKPASFGIKPKKESAPTNINHRLISFLHKVVMENSLNNHKLHYLCADFHLYQHQRVIIGGAFEIDVHIVGTGGADPDDYFDPTKHSIKLLQKSEPNATFTVDGELSLDTTEDQHMDKLGNISVMANCLTSIKQFGYLQITDVLEFKPVENRLAASNGGRKTKRKRKYNRKSLRPLILKKRR